MSARNELAEIIGGKLITRSSMGETADAVLAAGYRKPRTINDVDELNALPIGSVVLSRGRSFQRYEPSRMGIYTFHLWQSPDGGFVHTPEAAYVLLPATVLHEPEAQA